MEQHFNFISATKALTSFCVNGDNTVFLARLFNMQCGLEGRYAVPEALRGLLDINTDAGCFCTDQMTLEKCEHDNNSIFFTFINQQVKIESKRLFCARTGVLSCKDNIRNIDSKAINISRCLCRFVLTPSDYEIFSQASGWCCENQGIWQNMTHGSFVIRSEGGRTTQGGTPYICLRNKETGHAVAVHILPRGNWIIKASSYTADNYSLPFMVLEVGLSDENLNLELLPGQTFELPEILIHELPEAKPEKASPLLHTYLLHNHFIHAKRTAPIVYNTWFDTFENLEIERLRKQLTAAAEIGCEFFVVDAGWYGRGQGNWGEQVGDWREKQNESFRGRMADFAREVRSAGLGFGLWMEPERNFATVPAVKNNPHWFIKGTGDFYYPDLSNKEAYDYIFSEMSRLIESYQLCWMKVDFNFKLGVDPAGYEFAAYYEKWYLLLDQLRDKYPDVFFEGCASGGMRLDANTLQHFDGHFLSDNVNPADVLRMYQQAILRLPPGRITKWTVLRGIGHSIPQYGVDVEDSPISFVTPAGCGAIWEQCETVDIDFAVRVAMCGMFGLSGDIASVPKTAKQRLLMHVNFYKKWREFITTSVAHLLTPVTCKDDHAGWAAIQLSNLARKECLLFVYRLEDSCLDKLFRLQGLDSETEYKITVEHESSVEENPKTGEELMDTGLKVSLPKKFDAAIIALEPNDK